jgi:cell division protein FtsL
MRSAALLGIALLALSIFALFQVKYKVQNLRRDLVEIERQITADKQSIHVLEAEWAYLNRPERLKRLSDQYLDLRYVTVAQVKEGQGMMVASRESPHKTSLVPTPRPVLSSLKVVSR